MFKYYIILALQGMLFIKNILSNFPSIIEVIYILSAMLILIFIENYKLKKAVKLHGKELIDKNIIKNKIIKRLEILSKILTATYGLLLIANIYIGLYDEYKIIIMQVILLSCIVHSVFSIYIIYKLNNISICEEEKISKWVSSLFKFLLFIQPIL